jgi:HEAT repeat protein
MVAILIVALRDEDTAVRLHVARTLGRLGRQATAAVPELRRAEWDRALVVRRAAREALEKIGS